MGMKQLPKRSGEYLFEIVMRRYETRSTMMTSNRPLEDWGKLLGDVPAATAILDRFLHHAEIIQITGKSYRMHQQALRPSARSRVKTGQRRGRRSRCKTGHPGGALRVQNRPPRRRRPSGNREAENDAASGANREYSVRGRKRRCSRPKTMCKCYGVNIQTPA